jgi:hypothetical protein
LDIEGSSLGAKEDDACSYEKNSEPLPNGWSLTQEQDRKDSNEQKAQLIDVCDFRSIAHLFDIEYLIFKIYIPIIVKPVTKKSPMPPH